MTQRSDPATIEALFEAEGETSPHVPAGWLTTDIDGDVAEILYISPLGNSSTHYRIALVNHAINLAVHGYCTVWRRADNERISVSDWQALLPLVSEVDDRTWKHNVPGIALRDCGGIVIDRAPYYPRLDGDR